MLDSVTVLTPIPPGWWADQQDSETDPAVALIAAVSSLVEAGLADHAAVVVGEPLLHDTVTAREGETYIWVVDVEHDTTCPCWRVP